MKLLTFDASSLLVRTEAKNARPRDNRVVSHQTNGQSIKKDEKTNTTCRPKQVWWAEFSTKDGDIYPGFYKQN